MLSSPFRKFIYIVAVICILSCTQSPTSPEGMQYIPAGSFMMGADSDQASPDEFPKHKVSVKPFFMDATEVTNAQFNEFVSETGYITTAEQKVDWEVLKLQLAPGTPKPPDSLLSPGALVFEITQESNYLLSNPALWWKWKPGASWKHPQGPESNIDGLGNHPVVCISWDDAQAYAKWAGKRLPTEEEWEWAARGGLDNNIYPWGNKSASKDGHKYANFFQGVFPSTNTKKDGYSSTAPVTSFPPNGYGLYDMAGNVWEWCQDSYHSSAYSLKETSRFQSLKDFPAKVIRGGSFLCSEDYCSGYRNSRRMSTSADTGLNHTGFRCVRDISE